MDEKVFVKGFFRGFDYRLKSQLKSTGFEQKLGKILCFGNKMSGF